MKQLNAVMKRYPLPDLLKGFAIIYMVQIHITELFMDNAGRESLFGKLSMFLGGPLTAMIFMIVMGYFVAKSKKPPLQIVFRQQKTGRITGYKHAVSISLIRIINIIRLSAIGIVAKVSHMNQQHQSIHRCVVN